MIPAHYIPSGSRIIAGRTVEAWDSPGSEDPGWDAFLENTASGHFQQSSRWAEAKRIDRWQAVRKIFSIDRRIIGGFQILTHSTRVGGIGYIYKGPALVAGDSLLHEYLLDHVIASAKANNLIALIVQPPDDSEFGDDLMDRRHFMPNCLINVISATLLVDLSGSWNDITSRMRKSALAQVKRAKLRGITIREGCETDVSRFFHLMATTCRRQQTKPAPATEAAMLGIWKAFHKAGKIRLTFADYGGETIAGLLCILFGQRVTAWKKGWSGQCADRYPNQLITFEAIEWAHRQGCKIFDFSALDRRIARNMLANADLNATYARGRDWFNLGYGGKAILLPQSRIYITNQIARLIYKSVAGRRWFRFLCQI